MNPLTILHDAKEIVELVKNKDSTTALARAVLPKEVATDCEWHNRTLPFNIYDVQLSSSDGKHSNILNECKGKVTLIFNVAAGCGNIPQHSILEELNQRYKNEPNFKILAVVVDDFVCHGYPEFQNGLDGYITEQGLDITPGELAKKYAEEHFGTTYEFSELTNGRFDKHTYSEEYVPGENKIQEQHPLWSYLTGAFEADVAPNGVPYHNEVIPWSYAKEIDADGKVIIPPNVRAFDPLRGNFEKFLIDKSGTQIKRYANGFLLGERNITGETYPWFDEKWKDDGRRDHNPVHSTGTQNFDDEPRQGRWPNMIQRAGIDVSLEIISRDIDLFLEK